MNRISAALLLGLALGGCRPKPPATYVTMSATIDRGRAFVVDFYDWYAKPGAMKNIDSALAVRRSSFAPDLAALIDSDKACAVRTRGECNLEEDPILASQDPCERYEVGNGLVQGDTVSVMIFGICDGKRGHLPDVIAYVLPHDSGWRFIDFVYPVERRHLRAILDRRVGG